jgi:hypothetical protein
LDGPLPKLCPAVALSRQDGHHSAVVLLLKAALIQVSDYRLLGDLNVIFYQNMPNLHNRYKSAERKIKKNKPEHMLLLKAALIQVRDYRLLGASGFTICQFFTMINCFVSHF